MLVYGKYEYFVMHVLYLCVLRAPGASSQYCVLHALHFVDIGRGSKWRPYGRRILQRRSHVCLVGSVSPSVDSILLR